MSERRAGGNPVTRLMGAVVPSVVDAVPVEELIERVDVNELLDRIDVNTLLDRIDVDRLIQRVDLDTLLAKVDLDAVVDRIDIDRIVERADIPGIVSQSTKGITANTIDLIRRQVVGLDEIITRVAARLMNRNPADDPPGPEGLELSPKERPGRRPATASVSGHYAGPLARAAAFALDVSLIVFLFGLTTSLLGWTLGLIARDGEAVTIGRPWSSLLFAVWWFGYFALSLAIAGRTMGKGVVGLRVVRADGHTLRPAQAVLRTLVLPLSIVCLGLGLLGGVFGRRRRTWHDMAAGSTEVIDWGDRPAALPSPLARWVERHQVTDPEAEVGVGPED